LHNYYRYFGIIFHFILPFFREVNPLASVETARQKIYTKYFKPDFASLADLFGGKSCQKARGAAFFGIPKCLRS